jgi:PAS domain S-box-containing protein
MLTITAAALVAVAILVTLLMRNLRDRRMLALRTAQLAESEARWRRLAETVPAGIFHIAPDGSRLYVNPKLTQITGDPAAAADDRRVWAVHEPDLALVHGEWAAAAAALREISLTFRVRRMNDQAVRWVHVEARPLLDSHGLLDGWVGSTVDVTEETSSIADLRRFSEILAATPDLVAMVDARGHFTYANAAARARFGLDTDEKMAQLRAIDV